jgi:hypothetical protein
MRTFSDVLGEAGEEEEEDILEVVGGEERVFGADPDRRVKYDFPLVLCADHRTGSTWFDQPC